MISKASAEYRKVNTQSGVEGASPHRLIQMLMQGVLQRLAEARGAIQRQDLSLKGEAISKAIGIIDGLRGSLNLDAGGELAENLEALYLYMQDRLVEANSENSEEKLQEVAQLMIEIKQGWDGIAEQAATPDA